MPTHIHEMSQAQLQMAAEHLRALMCRERWIKGDYCAMSNRRDEFEGVPCFCLLGAVIQAVYPGTNLDEDAGKHERDAGQFVANAIEEFDVEQPCKAVIAWNDAPWRTWEEVDAVVDRIVKHYTTMSPASLPAPEPGEGGVPVQGQGGFV